MMDLTYSEFVREKWFSSDDEQMSLAIATIGMMGEAGEVMEKVNLLLHGGADATVSPVDVVKELGDTLFYTTYLANHFDAPLNLNGLLHLPPPGRIAVRLQEYAQPLAIVKAASLMTSEFAKAAEQIKKSLRGDEKPNLAEDVMAALYMGIYYMNWLGRRMNGHSIADIAELNMIKLQSRIDRGVRRGNGDDR